MPAIDDFDPGRALPRFLVVRAEQDNTPDESVVPSRATKVRVLIITAAAAGIAVLAIGNPVALVTEVSALLAGYSGLPPAPIQSAADAPALLAVAAADAQDLPPAASDAPARGEIAAAEPVVQDQAEKSEPPADALFKQFQAWAAEQDAQKQDAAEPVQGTATKIMQDEAAPATKRVRGYRQVQNRTPARAAVRNARAEARPQNLQRQVPQAARAPVPDPRAQDAATQDTQTAPFLGIFGQRN